MATPTAAGLAALVRQYFEHGYYPTGHARAGHGLSPSAALVKGILIASAVDLTRLGCTRVAPIPSLDQGWGLVQLDQALFLADAPGRRLLVRDADVGFSAPTDMPRATSFTVTSSEPLKVVLVWTDYPSTAAAAVHLVNDLDLTVNGPDGHFLGNVIGGGVSLPGGFPDRLNNVEVVVVERPTPGRWTVTVSPHLIAHGPQDHALVVTGALRAAPRRPRGGGRLGPINP
jgi:hypothetical protein